MDTTKFETFRQLCFRELPDEIDKILNAAKDEEACAIGFITTDDFYGIYLAWDYSHNINEYYEWKHGLEPDFLYQPLVDIVEDCKDIDFCNPSDEKWEFAQTLLSVLEKSIRQIPDGVFEKNGFKREDILFFSTMSDGDYIQEMMDTSVKMFNTSETLEQSLYCKLRPVIRWRKISKRVSGIVSKQKNVVLTLRCFLKCGAMDITFMTVLSVSGKRKRFWLTVILYMLLAIWQRSFIWRSASLCWKSMKTGRAIHSFFLTGLENEN